MFSYGAYIKRVEIGSVGSLPLALLHSIHHQQQALQSVQTERRHTVSDVDVRRRERTVNRTVRELYSIHNWEWKTTIYKYLFHFYVINSISICNIRFIYIVVRFMTPSTGFSLVWFACCTLLLHYTKLHYIV